MSRLTETEDDWLRVAEVLARCSDMARRDARLPLPVREKIANGQADRVIRILRQGIESKPDLRSRLKSSPSLAGLRDRADFKELVGK